MTTRSDLLERGFFPAELPPPFYTSDFSSKVISNIVTLHTPFLSQSSAKQLSHNLMRVGRLRRQLGIPNPILFYVLSTEIEKDWKEIQNHVNTSIFSKSNPITGPKSGRAVITSTQIKDLLPVRANLRSKSKYIVKTDISRFYPSIYSHSIPWALHTKALSKASRNNLNLSGNRIDKCIRNCQDGQTIGIPIGPDTSLVVAEIISTSIDKILLSKNRHLRGFRYVDDYEFGFQTFGQAEEMLALIQESLRSYELELNAQKTQILELPQPLESEWVQQIRRFQFRPTEKGQRSDITCFFDDAFRLAQTLSQEVVLKYAISCLSEFNCHPNNWELLQSLLLQTLMVEPSAIIQIWSTLLSFKERGYQLDLSSLSDVLQFMIIQKCSLGHCSEVAWAIWAMIVLGITIDKMTAQALSKVNDSIVAILSLDAYERGLIPVGLDTTLWESYMEPQELYGEQWLLSYEANLKKWLPSRTNKDHVDADANFHCLKSMGVEFYNSQKFIIATPTFASLSDGFAPLFSLS